MMPKVMMMMMAMIMLVSLFFAIAGINMHGQVPVEEAKFHELQDQYYSNSKAVRDGAASNSELTNQLVQIQQYPSSLLELKLVGVGNILTGIYALLFGILIALVMMPKRLGKIIKDQ